MAATAVRAARADHREPGTADRAAGAEDRVPGATDRTIGADRYTRAILCAGP
ncbi:hypothetical protein GCM10010524_21520 [Streptomyces mexicanus]